MAPHLPAQGEETATSPQWPSLQPLLVQAPRAASSLGLLISSLPRPVHHRPFGTTRVTLLQCHGPRHEMVPPPIQLAWVAGLLVDLLCLQWPPIVKLRLSNKEVGLTAHRMSMLQVSLDIVNRARAISQPCLAFLSTYTQLMTAASRDRKQARLAMIYQFEPAHKAREPNVSECTSTREASGAQCLIFLTNNPIRVETHPQAATVCESTLQLRIHATCPHPSVRRRSLRPATPWRVQICPCPRS